MVFDYSPSSHILLSWLLLLLLDLQHLIMLQLQLMARVQFMKTVQLFINMNMLFKMTIVELTLDKMNIETVTQQQDNTEFCCRMVVHKL